MEEPEVGGDMKVVGMKVEFSERKWKRALRSCVGVCAGEAWTVENDASPNVDTFDLQKDRQMYIYLTTMRIEVVGFVLHIICVLNSNILSDMTEKTWSFCRRRTKHVEYRMP